MSKKRHVVNVCKDFTHKFTVDALVVPGLGEIAPAEDRMTHYAEGTKLTFPTKKQALEFCKFHGYDKVLYQGLCKI